MPCPPHRMPETTASTAIGHSRSGVTKSQIRGTTEIPKEQTTRTGRAPNVSTRRPHAGAETMRSARSEERRVGKSVDVGGRRIIKKKTQTTQIINSRRAE